MPTTAPRILVATDMSDSSSEALAQADAHAKAVGGVLGICYVMPTSGVHLLFPQRYAAEAAEEAALGERLRIPIGYRVTSTTGRAPMSFEVFIEHGSPYAEVVRRAEAWGATRIVIGSHGHTTAPLGGTAEKVVRYAPCPVLVARPPVRHGLVLCATDLSAPSHPAVATAVNEARARNAKLLVLHVVEQILPLASVTASEGLTPLVLSPEMLRDLQDAARAEITSTLAKLEARAELAIVEGHPAPAIVQYIEENQPELVVLGTRGRTGLARVFLGSVAEHVTRAAHASVLVVRLAAS